MNTAAMIKPFVTEEGIELYATDTGTGSSIRGTAILNGVSSSEISKIAGVLEDPALAAESLKDRPSLLCAIQSSESLKPYLNRSIWLETLEPVLHHAKILEAEVVAAIIEFYAFEKNNEIAKFSYRKFAKMGIDSWIRSTTGHAIAPLSPLESAQQMIIGLQADLLIERSKTATTAKFIAQQGEGLSKMFDRQDQVDEYLALPAVYEDDGQPKSYTLRAYLEEILGIESVHKRLFFRFANLVSFTSKTHAYANPRQVKTAKGPVNVYTVQQFPLLQSAWEDAMRQEKDMRLKGKTSRREVLNPRG